MKFVTAVTVVMATAGLSAASHLHAHKHLHQRASDMTLRIYELNGQQISEAEVIEGLKNGTLVLANGGTSLTTPDNATPQDIADSKDKAADIVSSTPSTKAAVDLIGSGVGADFPDGQLPCSSFPSKYGAIPLNYLGLDGWTGVQQPNVVNGLFDDITTIVPGMGGCKEGAFCSYACPAGFGKSQWPETQGRTGQSIGGLQCKGGKLHLTRPGVKQLCEASASAVKVQVRNQMSKGTAICRTDYPGTESETIPIDATAGSTHSMFCPDAATYYHWQEKPTSAQYYLNPAGASIADGCQWNKPGSNLGNYAPMNAGVGYSNGAAWISIFPNKPTTNQNLDYNVRIEGGNVPCKYENGKFLSGPNFATVSDTGCTVSASSGTVTFVLY